MKNEVDDAPPTVLDPSPDDVSEVRAPSGSHRISQPARRVLQLLVESALVGIAGGVIAAFVVGWDPSQWRVFFSYDGDTFFNAINGALSNPLGVTNSTTRLGWPHGLSLTDFPAGEPIFTWFQWFAHRFTADDFTVLAAMWFLGFVLVAATTYLVLRGLGLSRWPSVVAALVYDFVPYHMWRAIGHTNLALYVAVPLGGMLLLWVMSGRLDRPPRSSSVWKPLWRTPDWWVVAGSAFVIAVSARYYAVFFLLFLIVVSVGRMLVEHRLRLGWAPAIVLALTLGLSLLTGLPQVAQVAGNSGRNTEVAQRSRTDSDLYALRLTDLLAPVPDHRLSVMAHLSDRLRRTVTRGEDGNSMGVVLLAGLAFIGGLTLVRRPRRLSRDSAVADPVGLATNSTILAGLALLFGTVGGLSGAIASFGFTQIRGWDRISIYISFCGAVGVALALSWLWTLRNAQVRWRRWLPVVVCPLVLALAILDQTGTTQPNQTQVAAARRSDHTFFTAMADQLGTGAAVFQLPYVPFPESGNAALDYQGFRGFFNDGGRLNWSYGGMRGRDSDWQRTWVTMDAETQVVGLAAAGFDAVMVDRVGYTPQNSPEPSLEAFLGPAKATSPDGRFAWYDLRPLHDRLVEAHGAAWVRVTGQRVVRPIGINFDARTYRSTGFDAQDWGSIGASTTIELRRYDHDTNPVDVQLGVTVPAGSQVSAASQVYRSTKTSTGPQVDFGHQLTMKPETVGVVVTTNAPNVASTTDARPDVRGQITELKVLDSALVDQIQRGELKIPPT
jgi:phosphoglycerol transferase